MSDFPINAGGEHFVGTGNMGVHSLDALGEHQDSCGELAGDGTGS
jgi:hypothetical protein